MANRFRRLVCTVVAMGLAVATLAWVSGGPARAEDAANDQQAELDQALIDTLSGSTLVGSFTVTREDSDPGELRQERYEIREVEKLQDNLFLFRFRVQYGDRDARLAAPFVVIWSGDTPVITLTNASIPGLGRYTARVLIYKDHYAGYWAAGDTGGHLFGVIEREQE